MLRSIRSTSARPIIRSATTTTTAFRRSLSSIARVSLTTPNTTSTRRTFMTTSVQLSAAGHGGELNVRPPPDTVLTSIAAYTHNPKFDNPDLAYDTAHYCLLDTLGCAFEALKHDGCTRLLGPVVPGTSVPNGARVPGTNYELDPIRAAWNFGCLLRWLDFNDCWLAAEWGHPSDNLGGILMVADWISRTNKASDLPALKVKDVLTAMIQAHEIQGCMALENSFNEVGLDHVVLVKLASAAVVSRLLGLTEEQTTDVVSQVFVDGQSLRTYRHAPNTGPRKSWAAGDATARAVELALLVKKGEIGYPSVLTAPKWGFYDNLWRKGEKHHGGQREFAFQREFGSYVMENVLFKISFPAEFHAQTAAEAAMTLHALFKKEGLKVEDIEEISVRTQEAAVRIIDKQGPLHNYADRDHCIQYMIAAPLLTGELTAESYTDAVASDPRLDELRAKIHCVKDDAFTADYHDPSKRSIGNALTVRMKDGRVLDEVCVEYPVGHRRRREEGIPLLMAKWKRHLGVLKEKGGLEGSSVESVYEKVKDRKAVENMDVDEFVKLFTTA
ncbi:ATP-binding cassette transporter CGR1 [Saitoella coloradoensis]